MTIMAHRYQQPSDQYSADWDVRGALDDLRLYYDVGMRVAQPGDFRAGIQIANFAEP